MERTGLCWIRKQDRFLSWHLPVITVWEYFNFNFQMLPFLCHMCNTLSPNTQWKELFPRAREPRGRAQEDLPGSSPWDLTAPPAPHSSARGLSCQVWKSTHLVFQSSSDLDLFFRAALCFSSSRFFSSLA